MKTMSLWEYANPKKFLDWTAPVVPWVAGLAALCIVVGLIWGFFFTPDDFRQGSTVKIIYLHVPSAFLAINAWFMMVVASISGWCGATMYRRLRPRQQPRWG
jgi:heme exporter protein C